jgi:hypothetical protein
MADKVSDKIKEKLDKDLARAGPSGSTDKTSERESKMEDEGGPPPDLTKPQAPLKKSGFEKEKKDQL